MSVSDASSEGRHSELARHHARSAFRAAGLYSIRQPHEFSHSKSASLCSAFCKLTFPPVDSRNFSQYLSVPICRYNRHA